MRALLAALLGALAVAAPAEAAPALVTVGSFDSPVHVTGSPGDTHRLFVVEQPGRVRVVVDGVVQAAPFLDISAEVLSGGERGLLSIAFPPDFQASGRFYVYLTARDDGHIEVREYRRADPDHADPATGRTLLSIPHPVNANHNGGQLQFGPDGRLWIGTGDGGNHDDTHHNAQDPASRLGKILRLDPLAGAPPDTYALGIRNPWRFSFDRATHDLVIGDVGQNAREEVDFAPATSLGAAGVNYGWPCLEGTRVNTDTDDPVCASPPPSVAPVFERSHAGDVCSITGGYVVRDPGLPTLAGRYLYGDLCGGALRSLNLADGRSDRAEALAVPRPTSFGEDVCGRLYVASLDGPVYRIQDGTATPCPVEPAGGGLPTAPDTTQPRLKTSVNGVHSLAARRRLRIAITTSELVTAVVSGRLHGVARFRTARVQLPAGRTVVKLRISRRTARRLRRALRHKPRVIATLSITLRDDAGNTRRGKRRVKIRG